MCHTLPPYGKACPHVLKSHHIIHVPYHVAIHHNMAHTTNFKRQYTIYILTQVNTELKIEIHIINSFLVSICHI